MCLILLAHRVHPDYPLIVAANRDEFYARATASAHYWQRPDDLLAGRDLEAGGTWLGVSRSGRFAAVTNVSEPPPMEVLRSRGELTSGFLLGSASSQDYADALSGSNYRGFNLLLWDGETLVYESNRNHGRALEPGFYGLANAGLDEEKFRVTSGREGLRTTIQDGFADAATLSAALLALLEDRNHPDAADPATTPTITPTGQHTLDPARLARFIVGEEYGTRASTAVLLGAGAVHFTERVFVNRGEVRGDATFRFELTG
ncbi:MAG: NRDE family protein [Pseudomonadota bacterium]